MENRNDSQYELVTQTSYPPILRNRKNGHEWVLTTQTEIVLSQLVVDLISRVEKLEKQVVSILKKEKK